jgi:hypothetical protein
LVDHSQVAGVIGCRKASVSLAAQSVDLIPVTAAQFQHQQFSVTSTDLIDERFPGEQMSTAGEPNYERGRGREEQATQMKPKSSASPTKGRATAS